MLGSCNSKGKKGRSYINTKGVNKGNVATQTSPKRQQEEENLNMDSDGYAYSFARTRINYQGSSGMGMGGSYASTYYAGEDKKIAAERKNPSKTTQPNNYVTTDSTAYIDRSYPEADSAYTSSDKDTSNYYKQEWQQYNW